MQYLFRGGAGISLEGAEISFQGVVSVLGYPLILLLVKLSMLKPVCRERRKRQYFSVHLMLVECWMHRTYCDTTQMVHTYWQCNYDSEVYYVVFSTGTRKSVTSCFSARKPKEKDWAENDYYDSDEDTFLDRTGISECYVCMYACMCTYDYMHCIIIMYVRYY